MRLQRRLLLGFLGIYRTVPEPCLLITSFCPLTASSLCFAEKTIYTQEVLAVVLQQLMEMNPLPTLFMRTVIISLPVYLRVT